MTSTDYSTLTELKNRYSARESLISAVLNHITSDPEFGEELAQALLEAGCKTGAVSAQGSRRGTQAEQIMAYFRSRGNEWAEVSQIRKATDIGRGAIANVLYKTHVHRFEHQQHPSHKSRKVWRLKPKSEQERLLTPIGGDELDFKDQD
ncbi:hypothetical protein [Algisphaera agarilytica]|uniref:Uncharacterized protein n=1 Tax=Algisphaera agarilytica TaxID=1385975 RepID=A0A7X0H3C6_9BACT|nr:hypothetical protein [Algisphaera agarilytica]MBB6428465.1 hypothetical protein [Algisphaera agarilytica]